MVGSSNGRLPCSLVGRAMHSLDLESPALPTGAAPASCWTVGQRTPRPSPSTTATSCSKVGLTPGWLAGTGPGRGEVGAGTQSPLGLTAQPGFPTMLDWGRLPLLSGPVQGVWGGGEAGTLSVAPLQRGLGRGRRGARQERGRRGPADSGRPTPPRWPAPQTRLLRAGLLRAWGQDVLRGSLRSGDVAAEPRLPSGPAAEPRSAGRSRRLFSACGRRRHREIPAGRRLHLHAVPGALPGDEHRDRPALHDRRQGGAAPFPPPLRKAGLWDGGGGRGLDSRGIPACRPGLARPGLGSAPPRRTDSAPASQVERTRFSLLGGGVQRGSRGCPTDRPPLFLASVCRRGC